MKPGPRAAFNMVEAEIVFCAMEALFDMPVTVAKILSE